MRTRNQEIVMPEKSRVMTQEEMEYEGGWLNFIVGAAATCISIGASALGSAGIVDKKYTNAISMACDLVSTVTMGVSAASICKTAIALTTKSSSVKMITYSVGAGFRKSYVNTWDSVGNSLAGACGDASLGCLNKAVSLASR